MTENSTQRLRQKAALFTPDSFSMHRWHWKYILLEVVEVVEEAEAPYPAAGCESESAVSVCFVFPLCYTAPSSAGLNSHQPPPVTLILIISQTWFCLHPHTAHTTTVISLPPANPISTKSHSQWVSKLKLNCCFHILPPIGCCWRSAQSHHVALVLDNKTQKCGPQLEYVKKTSPKFVLKQLCLPALQRN